LGAGSRLLGFRIGTGLSYVGCRLGEGPELMESKLKEDGSMQGEGGINFTPNGMSTFY
jgi:hypothetical protein